MTDFPRVVSDIAGSSPMVETQGNAPSLKLARNNKIMEADRHWAEASARWEAKHPPPSLEQRKHMWAQAEAARQDQRVQSPASVGGGQASLSSPAAGPSASLVFGGETLSSRLKRRYGEQKELEKRAAARLDSDGPQKPRPQLLGGPSNRFASDPEPLQPAVKKMTTAELVARLQDKQQKSLAELLGTTQTDDLADDSDEDTDSEESGNSTSSVSIPTRVIHEDPDGRPYSRFENPEGKVENFNGCIFPRGYQPHVDDKRRFVCPVRNCRRASKHVQTLVGHIRATHCKTTFNDNLDGTFSPVGAYRNPGKTSPPVVVSCKPLSPDASPPVSPYAPYEAPEPSIYPSLGRRNRWVVGRNPDFVLHDAPTAATPPSVSPPVVTPPVVPPEDFGAPSPPREVIFPLEYLNAFLSHKQVVPRRDDVEFMKYLPYKRELPQAWLLHHSAGVLDPIQYSCALAYITGDEVKGPGACSRAAYHSGPFRLSDTCVAFPPAPPHVKSSFAKHETCVGCKYWSSMTRQVNRCDWNVSKKPETLPDSTQKLLDRHVDIDKEVVEDYTPVILSQEEESSVPKHKHRLRPTRNSSSYSERIDFARKDDTQQEDDLAMESWEYAPGRVTDKDSGANIGFSSSFLRSGEPLPVAENTGCHIICLKPGDRKKWAADDRMLRISFVGTGKVNVKVGDTTAQYGPDSAIVIPPGKSCLMENKRYKEVKLYCTTQKDIL